MSDVITVNLRFVQQLQGYSGSPKVAAHASEGDVVLWTPQKVDEIGNWVDAHVGLSVQRAVL